MLNKSFKSYSNMLHHSPILTDFQILKQFEVLIMNNLFKKQTKYKKDGSLTFRIDIIYLFFNREQTSIQTFNYVSVLKVFCYYINILITIFLMYIFFLKTFKAIFKKRKAFILQLLILVYKLSIICRLKFTSV